MKISKEQNSDGTVSVWVTTPIIALLNKYIIPFIGAGIALSAIAFLLNFFIYYLPDALQIAVRLVIYIPVSIYAFKVIRAFTNRPILKIYPGEIHYELKRYKVRRAKAVYL